MPGLLVINPNTSANVTAALSQQIAARVPPEWRVTTATASFGAAYIVSEASYAIAAHAVLDAWAHASQFDAVLVGCFGDPGLEGLRELSTVPVIGLAEASMTEAARHGRFAIVTGGARWPAILQRRAAAAGLEESLAGIQIIPESGAELLATPERTLTRLTEEAWAAHTRFGADAVLIGGAALAGMGDAIAGRLDFPVIDNVSAAARAVAQLPPACSVQAQMASYSGLSEVLTRRLENPAQKMESLS